MIESLIVERDDALALARELADRRGTSVDDAVVEALRGTLARTEPPARAAPQPVRLLSYEELNPEQQASYDRLKALVEEYAPYRVPGATSDHRDMYDDYGLPI
ncbi:type II toxin-antitoxin system VapB family antitoxin [Methylobacterium sp. J-076]|uniref:type II toxin-antitoxin system VapB family antitoxin n=1 Tax=Methylobacterium sp. J-076 TaxID=2836655 RepID=UPI001FBAFC3F|nr:type II toxin-antitoxin system VapB family antitoxin [Methylobacterium sp. J-076]MCJ2015064.1 type II toxin-antitoxin system VapB family antitoxin [Methylobacterium sp. J-076]